jgi:hypothetical protein
VSLYPHLITFDVTDASTTDIEASDSFGINDPPDAHRARHVRHDSEHNCWNPGWARHRLNVGFPCSKQFKTRLF